MWAPSFPSESHRDSMLPHVVTPDVGDIRTKKCECNAATIILRCSYSTGNPFTFATVFIYNIHGTYLRMDLPKLDFATKYGHKYGASSTANPIPRETLSFT